MLVNGSRINVAITLMREGSSKEFQGKKLYSIEKTMTPNIEPEPRAMKTLPIEVVVRSI